MLNSLLLLLAVQAPHTRTLLPMPLRAGLAGAARAGLGGGGVAGLNPALTQQGLANRQPFFQLLKRIKRFFKLNLNRSSRG